jgi:uncharacterized membrane protein
MFLLACTSMYFGTGWTGVLFLFPIAPELTPDNYYLQFVPQMHAAVHVFTWMTGAMIVSALVMLAGEWKRGVRWVPLGVLVGIVAATLLTTQAVFPLNDRLASHITDPSELRTVLAEWVRLSTIRAWIWTGEWALMAIFFGRSFFKLEPAR